MGGDPLKPSPISATVDFDRRGAQHGFLRLPHSRDDSAWGSVMIPIAVVANGQGPTALLTGANHGDEYEGPISLFELARTLDPGQIQGRVIIVPAMNYPAFRAGTRTSPIDRGNLNRLFPGRPDGTVTEKIADYFTRHLLPLADLVLDIHSGGKTLEFVPFAAAHLLPDERQEARCMAAVAAFAAPYSLRMLEIDAVGMYDTAAEALGKTFLTTELGGGGTARAETLRIAERGVRNVLRHAGVLEGAIEHSPTQVLEMRSDICFVFTEEGGLIRSKVDLGQAVRSGDVVSCIYPIHRTGAPVVEYRAQIDGILAARHFPGLVQQGDCIAVIAQPVA